jgi:hypothetical protein
MTAGTPKGPWMILGSAFSCFFIVNAEDRSTEQSGKTLVLQTAGEHVGASFQAWFPA